MSVISSNLKGIVAATAVTIASGCSSLNSDFQSSLTNQTANAFDKSISEIISHDHQQGNLSELRVSSANKETTRSLANGSGIEQTLKSLEDANALLLENPIAGAQKNRILMVTAEASKADVANAFDSFYGERVTTTFTFSPLVKNVTPSMQALGTSTTVTFDDGTSEQVLVQQTVLGETAINNALTANDKYKPDVHNSRDLVSEYVNSELATTVEPDIRIKNFREFISNHELVHSFGGGGGLEVDKYQKRREIQHMSGEDYEHSDVTIPVKNGWEKADNMMKLIVELTKKNDKNTVITLNGEIVADVGAAMVMQKQLPDSEWEALKEDIIDFRTELALEPIHKVLNDDDNPLARTALDHETLQVLLPVFKMIDEHRVNPNPAITEFTSTLTNASIFAYVVNDEIQQSHGESITDLIADGNNLRDITDELNEMRETGHELLNSEGGLNKVLERTINATPDSLSDAELDKWIADNSAQQQADLNIEQAFVFGDSPESTNSFEFNEPESAGAPTVEAEPAFVFENEDKLKFIADSMKTKKEAPISSPTLNQQKLSIQ